MGQNDCVGHIAPEKRALELAAFKPADRTAQNAAPFPATADRNVKPAYDETLQGEAVDRLQKSVQSQIQALDRTQPGLPMKKSRAGTMTHDYKR